MTSTLTPLNMNEDLARFDRNAELFRNLFCVR